MIDPKTADALRPLVLLLSSDQPGEVVAAANRIGKVLARANLDWHVFADAIGNTKPSSTNKAPDWSVVTDALHDSDLSRGEAKFVQSMREILSRGFEPTPKQAAWLRSLYCRQGGVWQREAA